MKDWKITVMGDWGRDESLLAKADVIAGGTRLLDSLPASYRAERVALDVHLLERIRDLQRRAERENVVILASGDPLYHGIGGTIAKLAGREHLRVLPCVTAFQRLFAALGRPWNGASLFSLHGVEENLPWRRILNASTAIVYGDHRRTASGIAAQLISCFPESASRSAAIGSELGTEQEKVCSGTLAEMASMNAPALSVLALFPAEVTPGIPLGLPDEKYEHQNRMITHPEVRAVVLSKLRLRSGVLWDLGAGSGSVGIEAAGLCPELAVFSVEKDSGRAEQIRKNAEKQGVDSLQVFEDEIVDAIGKLPDPDRIFFGGGSEDLESAFQRLKPGGILVATGILIETCSRLAAILPEHRKELLNLNISRAGEFSSGLHLWRAENPITIAVFEK